MDLNVNPMVLLRGKCFEMKRGAADLGEIRFASVRFLSGAAVPFYFSAVSFSALR